MKATDTIGEYFEGGFAINLDGVSDEEEVVNKYFNAAWVQQTRAENGAAECESGFLTLWVSFLVGVASVDETCGRVQLVLQLHVKPSSLAECIPSS